MHILDGMPQTIVHGAGEGAAKIAEAVEIAGARVAKGAGQASGMASEFSGQLKGRVAKTPLDIKDAKLSVKEATAGMREARLNMREKMMRSLTRSTGKRRGALLPSTDAMVKAQLVKTSRELAHESSDLNAAIDSLNKIIKANRRGAAKTRTRLLGGLAMGAALMYHFDAEHGRERRAATARMLTSMMRGQHESPPTAPTAI